MKSYIARRLLWAVFVSWVALSVVFFLLLLAPNPNDQAAMFSCGVETGSIETCKETIKTQRGANRPVTERYIDFVLGIYTGNWGFSTLRDQWVTRSLQIALPYTMQFVVPSFLISALIGYAFGIYSAFNQYSKTDYGGSFAAYIGISLPEFWYGILLILVFAVWLGWLPVYYESIIPEQYGWFSWQNIKQLVLPITVTLTTTIANELRFSRAQTLEYVNAEFTKVAKAKGASQYRLMTRHALRVALVPLVTFIIGDLITVLWVNVLVVEVVFQIPGVGLLAYQAMTHQDTALVIATFLIPVFLAVIGYLVQDVLYVLLDPRIDYGDR